MSRVSVALGTCNGTEYLKEQLDSLGRQTLPPFELVVSDDASTDDTIEVVEAFSRAAPFPVRLVRNPQRRGIGANFMRAAALCRGEFLAFCDQDDVWQETKLERCVDALRGDVVLAVHACAVVDGRLRPLRTTVPNIPRSRIAPRLTTSKWLEMPGMAMVFRQSLLALLDWERRPDAHHRHGRLLHDEWIYGLARLAGEIAFLAEPLCLYRQHTSNVEGAPAGDLSTRARRTATTGASYYAARATQARGWAELLAEAAIAADDPERGRAYATEAESYRRLADTLSRRVLVYAPGARRSIRAKALGAAVARGVYRSRKREGFGLRGLGRDVAMMVLGRSG